MKLLLVDDEPLVLAGMQSMLNWNSLGIEICGTAQNGQDAYQLICQLKPQIVICDIRMPVMSGLDLMKKCRETDKDLPVFIMLTSYEEFEYARAAIHLHVSDYLVKLELTPESLTRAVQKAMENVRKLESTQEELPASMQLSVMQNQFFFRLLNNLLEPEDLDPAQAEKRYRISLTAAGYAAVHLKLYNRNAGRELTMTLYTNTLQMFQNILSKYTRCYTVSLDIQCFSLLICLDESHRQDVAFLQNSLLETTHMLQDYFNVGIIAGIGSLIDQLDQIPQSYNDAKLALTCASEETPIVCAQDIVTPECAAKPMTFNLSLFKDDMIQAFENYDVTALHKLTENIQGLFDQDSAHFAQALDAVSGILHYALTLIPDGRQVITDIFEDRPDNYLQLYECKTTAQVMDFLLQLTNGLDAFFTRFQQNYKSHFTLDVKQYIDTHLEEKLSLKQVAETFSISPNYLSQIFKQSFQCGFNEYITREKIEYAKKMLAESNLRIYEVAERLGFENAFYFSRVFKKVTGQAPKDFLQKK